MSAQPENVPRLPQQSWDTVPLRPRVVLLIAERNSLENVPEGVEVIWLTPGKPMPLVVQR